ncbi:MAG: hypothetical protein DRG59_08045, partial [Deltaproteobacteria bacterium]
VNFLVLPYFFLDKHQYIADRIIEYRETRTIDGEEYEILWRVYPHPDFGIPRDFERRLHRAVEYIISKLERPVRNPIPLGSRRNLARIMGEPYSGAFSKKVKDGILKMVMTGITTKKAYYNKRKKVWIEKAFHMYDKAVFTGEEMDDGTIADMNYLYLSEPFLQNINASYVCPIDYKFLRSLRPIAARLYELLSVKFYGHAEFIQYRYSTLCKLLPVKQRRYYSDAKRQLNPAHEELVRKGFLLSYEWTPVSGVRNDWYIRYVPNPKFAEVIDISPATETLPESPDEKKDSSSHKIQDLLKMVTEKHQSKKTIERTIAKACKKYDFERIARNIRYANSNCKKNYRAFLIKALENDWGLELQEDEEARKEILQKEAEKARKEQELYEHKKRVQAYIQNLSAKDRQKLEMQAKSEIRKDIQGKDASLARMLILSQMEAIISRKFEEKKPA